MPNHISDRRFQSLKTGIIPEIKSIFPIQVENKNLELRDIEITDKKDILNYPDQRKAILENKTWGEDIVGTFELSENEKLIGKKKIKIGELPKLTTRGTFLIDGTEYHIFNQLRLRPGVYTVQKDNKEIETKFNFLPKDKISGFNITFKKGKFNIAIHNRQIPLYSILKAFDIPDKNIENIWGKEILEQNKLTPVKNEENISKLYSSIFYKDPDNYEQAVSELKTKFENTQLTPEILQDTLNLNTDHLSKEVFLKASQKLLNVIKGKEKPDERDNLRNKQIYTPQDLLVDRIHRLSPKIQKDISRKLRRETDIRRVVDSYVINKPIKTFFTQTDLSSVSEGTNPINLAESFEKITTLGEGGIKDILAAPESSREVHPSHFGIIDVLHTAESAKVGLTTHLALGTDIQNKEPIKVVNDKDGKTRALPYKEFFNSKIGIDRTPVKGKINALFKGEKIKISPEKVDYYIDNPSHFFDISTNLIPFLNYNQGNRAITGAKMMGQALSLKDREEPLTQEFYAKDRGSMEKLMMELPESPVGGIIEKIDKESITIKGEDKKSYTINLYNNFPIESNAYLQNIPVVKKGDSVKKGQILAENNFSKNGKLALGKHLRTAIMPWHGFSYQDGIVISESAAQKLTSNHLYRINIPIEENSTFNLKKFRAYYPDKITKSLAEKLTEDGVIKVGQKVDAGDIIAAKLNKVEILPDEIKLGKLSKSLVKPYRDQSSVWDKTVPGVVTDIVKSGKQIQVYIKTEEPTVVGDKLSARSANKGIVSIIVPDDEMPKTKDGEHMEILINPLSIPSRVILGQLLEIGSNKLAKKKGHPLLIKNFEKGYTKTLLSELKKEGLKDKEILYNPKTNKPYKNPILTGPQYFLKLKHQVGTQFSARDYGSIYDLNMQPLSGSDGSAKALDTLSLYGMLAHGSNANIKEMVQFKSTKNPDYWRAIQTGAPLPTPKPTFAFQKFINHLNGLGINVKQNDNQFMLLPLTDKDILERSSGELKHPEKILKGHKMDPEDQGLFDVITTGGLKGTKNSHFKLSEPMPNPIFENGIKALTGIKGENYKKLVTGKLYIEKDGTLTEEKTDLTGGKALQYLLSKINVGKELESAQQQITTAKGSTLDGLNKKIKYLETLKVHKLDPTVYILNNIPVMPPTFRQIYPLPKGNIFISDINKAYKNLALANNKLKELKQELPDEDLILLREKLYQGVNALMGVTGAKPLGFEPYKGILDILAGPTPKRGMYQGTQIRRTLEGTGRATITSDPYLGVDEIGLPEQMSWTLFTPFVVRRLHKSGYSINEAHKLIKEQKDVARKALVQEMNEHPVLLNRAPSLHKFNIMAFQPKLVSGKQIAMTHLPMTGFNADVDGDSLTVHVPISKSAIKEAYKMFPSQHLKKPGTGELMLYPQHESLMGLYYLTKPGETIQKKYKEQKDILQDLRKKTIELDTTISLQGKKITAGTALVNSILPPNIQIEKPIDKKEMLRVLNLLSKDSKQYAGTVDKLKNLGYEYITERGYSFGLKDIAIGFPEKKEILSTFKPENSEEINKKLDKLISTKFTKEQNPIFDAVVSGARAKPSDIRKMLISPVTALDSYGNITEKPIKSSYSEGLSLNEYLDTSFGVRRGVIGKSKEVTQPGWFNKKLLASTADVIITDKEISDPGIDMTIDHQDILDRFTAKAITLNKDSKIPKDTLITEDLINKLNKENINQIRVRSPLSVTHNQLIPQKSFGLLENGELPKPGTNIGIIASQSISEPMTQSALSLFHSPGVAQGAPTGGYFEISRLLDMPKTIADKAELASTGGKVGKIKKTELGYDIQIGDKFDKLITAQKLKVKQGDIIERGRPLTEGKIDPKELVLHTGIENTQKFLTDNLERVYHEAGIPIKRKYLEVIIQRVTDNAKIVDPGKSDFLPGDIVPATKLKQVEMETGTPIKYEPYLRGINLAPLMTEDFLARLNFGHLKKTVSEGALRGWSSNIKSTHPVPGIVYGADLEAEPYEVD